MKNARVGAVANGDRDASRSPLAAAPTRNQTMKRNALLFATTLIALNILNAEEATTIRIGHFPNVTHAQAVYAHATGELDKKLGVKVEWSTFNAGPSAIEALFVNSIDAAYIGPNPAINGYIKSNGQALRIVAGATVGGAALVVRKDENIATDQDFHDKLVATPQLGNTQDVAARGWFQSKGYKLKEKGGDLTLIPLANPDQLLLFQKKEISGAWTVEPWVSRLEIEGGGRIFLEEKTLWPKGEYVTAQLIVSKKFLDANPTLVGKLIAAHVDITKQINKDKAAAAAIINRELAKETGKELPAAVLSSAMKRLTFNWDPIRSSLKKSAEDAQKAGFYRQVPNLDGIYDLVILSKVLKEKGLPSIP